MVWRGGEGDRQRAIEDGTKHQGISARGGCVNILPRLPQGSNNLPWVVYSLATTRIVWPGGRSWDGDVALPRGVDGVIEHGSGTNGTARIPVVCGPCVAGRQRSGSGSGGLSLRGVRSTPRRNESAVGELPSRRRPKGLRPTARGHAAKTLFHIGYATGRVATSRHVIPVGRRLRIVAKNAARRCAG
jgi:hypothetical protein